MLFNLLQYISCPLCNAHFTEFVTQHLTHHFFSSELRSLQWLLLVWPWKPMLTWWTHRKAIFFVKKVAFLGKDWNLAWTAVPLWRIGWPNVQEARGGCRMMLHLLSSLQTMPKNQWWVEFDSGIHLLHSWTFFFVCVVAFLFGVFWVSVLASAFIHETKGWS